MDGCEQFSHYFSQKDIEKKSLELKSREHKKKEKVLSPLSEKPVEKVKEKLLFTQTEPFELRLGEVFELTVHNPSATPCEIEVKNLDVNESEHDEIVQFSRGISHLTLAPEGRKKFKLFLEESYYRQFVKGTYRGSIDFSVLFESGKKENLSKSFFFEVE